ncbi:Uu.00g087820.m01.CDS01 [Anthostomella pinea]|uniref:Uu.00g087820.m01.CDS01 n=1 Tax=Anthostomella pinea TaxID=933095 RepID=A0AAI8VMB9_9PEZI|nr:Uu.00g087820.m01.CDS01 [Anthostomella pinea]
MFGFDEARDKRDKLYDGGEEHQSSFSHELIGGGAGFEAMKLFEDRQRNQGEPVKHALAKEMLAGIAGAEVDKLFETKGLDAYDREKAKHHAKKQAEELYDQQYGGQGDEFDPNSERPNY